MTVDDHALLRVGIATLIGTQLNLKLLAASNGREAIALSRARKPDVTLMEIQMPEVDGNDVLIASRGDFPGARVIALTKYSGDVQTLRAHKAGAQAYLLKSQPEELLDTVRHVYTSRKRVGPKVAAPLAHHALDDALTEREVEVLEFIAAGNSNKAHRRSAVAVGGHGQGARQQHPVEAGCQGSDR